MTSIPSQLYHQTNHYQQGTNSKLLTTSMNTNDDILSMKPQRELGIIEKLCSTYGFVYCCHRDGRYFFHFSEYKNDIHQAKIGDVVEFETTIDKRKKKPVAVNLTPVSPEIVDENRVEGTIAVVARQQQTGLQQYDIIPDGKVTYVKKGETYFLPYGFTDLQESNISIKVGDQVSFNVVQDRRTNQFFARNIKRIDNIIPSSSSSSSSNSKRFRGVISTMKDSFGFIEREDALKEIFFHVTAFGPNVATNDIQPGLEVEFDIQDRHNKEVANNIIILSKGTVEFDEIDKTPYIGRILQTLQSKIKKIDDTLPGRLLYDTMDKKMSELPFGERDRCGLFTLLENDIVQFVIAKDKRDGMMRATQITLLDQSFLKSKEHRQIGIVTKLDNTLGGQIKCLSSNEIVSFRFSEVMKDNFQISEGDTLEFTLSTNSNNGDLLQAIRIKLISKENFSNGHSNELRLTGIVERDANDGRIERNVRSNDLTEIKQQTNGNDSLTITTATINNRQHEPGIIRYVHDGTESTIQYSSANLANTSALYCGDKVEFSMTFNSKQALNIILIERNRIRGWISILREGKGFIEQNTTKNNLEPIGFSSNAFTGDNTQVELGDDVEFSLRKISGRLIAENILKIPSIINNSYSILPTIHRGRVVSPIRMISNDECEILGRIQKLNDDGTLGECFTYGITGVKNKRVILLSNDSVTFSVAVGNDYSTRAVNIVLENETRKGKVDTVKGQFGFIDFACEENKKIFFHNSEIEAGFELRAGDEVEFYAQYNQKSGKPCASKLRRINNLQRPDRLITKLKSINFDENTRQKLVVVRQPRNAEEKSKGFTNVRIERTPGILIKAQN